MSTPLLLTLIIFAIGYVCWTAGAIYDRWKVQRDDLNARDTWHHERGDC